MPGPLAGIRVLDLTSVVSGPLATMFLTDQGAEVIKIEPLGGDITRRSRQSISASGEFSALFVSSNRGKRSLALDLKQPEAAKIMRKLIAGSDVLVQNFRPGTMERLGLGEPALRELKSRLIYVSISGAGERGPYTKKRVYDPIIQGLSGLADLQAEPKTRRPQMIRTIVADKTTAIFAAQAVTAALFARERTGEGQHIRLAMLDTMIAYLWPEAMTQYTVVGREATTADPTGRPDLIFETADGYITVGTISDSEWQGFCAASDRRAQCCHSGSARVRGSGDRTAGGRKDRAFGQDLASVHRDHRDTQGRSSVCPRPRSSLTSFPLKTRPLQPRSCPAKAFN